MAGGPVVQGTSLHAGQSLIWLSIMLADTYQWHEGMKEIVSKVCWFLYIDRRYFA